MPSLKPTRAAEPARVPPDTRDSARAAREFQEATSERRGVETAWIVRGFLLLGVIVLLASIARAGLDRTFVHGWWRQW